MLSCNLLHKGKIFSSVVFGDFDGENTDNLDSKPVVGLTIGYPFGSVTDDSQYYQGLPELDFVGLSMEDTEGSISDRLGEPDEYTKVGTDYLFLDYQYSNGYLFICVKNAKNLAGGIVQFDIYTY